MTSSNVHGLKDLEKKDKEPTPPIIAKYFKEATKLKKETRVSFMWNGRFIHWAAGRSLLALRISVEVFMLAAGFGLIALGCHSGPLSLLPLSLMLPSLYGMYRTSTSWNVNEIHDGLGQILGGIENIDKLPILDLNKEDGMTHAIMRTVKEGKTQAVIFNFEKIPIEFSLRSTAPYHNKSTCWIFLLESNLSLGMQPHKTEDEEGSYKNYILPAEGDFLERLVKQKGRLTLKGNSYRMTKPMEWEILKSKKDVGESKR